MTTVFALPTKWRLIDEKGLIFGFNEKGEMRPTTDVVLTAKEVKDWREAVELSTNLITALKGKRS